jgi:hypothetical protein
VRREARRLRDDGRVQRRHREASLADERADPLQQSETAGARKGRVVTRKVPSEVPEVRCAEERVHERVQ